MEITIGLILVTLAGLGAGTVTWTMKIIKDLHFEQFLFIYMLSGLLLCPWIITIINVPNIGRVISSVGFKPLLISNLLSICWATANIMYMVSVIKIGAALSGAILTALGMSVGIIAPMVLKGTGLFHNAPNLMSEVGIFIIIGLVAVIIGLILVINAGFGREKELNKDQNIKKGSSGSFMKGLLLIISAGILSSGLSLAFVYSQGPIIEAVKLQGSGEIAANFSVWALGILGGAVISIAYPALVMMRKKTWKLLFARKNEVLFGIIGGVQLILSIVFLGRGMVLLGILGASIGFGIQQSMQVVGNQLVGFVSGEWKGVYSKPRKVMYAALGIIVSAVVIFALSNTLT